MRHPLLIAAALLLSVPALAEIPEGEEGVGRLAAKTCNTLDALSVAGSQGDRDPTGPASGAAVWGCYFGAFFGMSAAPVGPGVATACGTAAAGVIGAIMGGRPILPVILWSLPGVGVGVVFSLLGVGLALGSGALALLLGTTTPLLAVAFVGVLVFSLMSMSAGPLALAGVIYAEEQSALPEPERPPEPTTVGLVQF